MTRKRFVIGLLLLLAIALAVIRVHRMLKEAEPLGAIDFELSRDIQAAESSSFVFAGSSGHAVRLTGTTYKCVHGDSPNACLKIDGLHEIDIHCSAADDANAARAAQVGVGALLTVQGRMHANDDDPFLFLTHCELVSQ